MTEPDHVSTVRAVYDASADAYVEAIGTEVTHAVEGPIDRALLVALVELVSGSGVGPVPVQGPLAYRRRANTNACGLDSCGSSAARTARAWTDSPAEVSRRSTSSAECR